MNITRSRVGKMLNALLCWYAGHVTPPHDPTVYDPFKLPWRRPRCTRCNTRLDWP